jgi:hypothetical protein
MPPYPKPPRLILWPIGPSIAYVPLGGDLYSTIETDDIPRVGEFSWYENHGYAQRTSSGAGGARRQNISLHRFLMGDGYWQVDHKNGRTLDNRRRGNLREATIGQNQQNAKRRSDNKTGFKGVSYCQRDRAYVARAWHNGKRIAVAYCKTAEEAYGKRCAFIAQAHGEFARTA